jgi:dienelactone hydrolase
MWDEKQTAKPTEMRGQRIRRCLLYAFLTGIALAVALYFVLFPVPTPPPLPGPHAVGTLTIEIPAVGDSPRLLAQVWFPTATSSGGQRVPWLPDAALAPSFPYQRIASATSHARAGVPLLEGQKFPVIFYEHSWTGHRAENIPQVESLASKGFVVIAIDHPGQAARVRYADGSVIETELTEALDLTTEKNTAAFEATAQKCMKQRIAEISRIKAALAENTIVALAGKLRLERMGVFGFSFGGSTAIRLCATDSSFIAGANEDGLFLGDAMPRGPFLFFDQEMPAWLLSSPSPKEDAGQVLTRHAEANIQQALQQAHRPRFILDGANHSTFSDKIYYCRFPRLARAGKRSATEIHGVLCTQLGDFFTRHLTSTDR